MSATVNSPTLQILGTSLAYLNGFLLLIIFVSTYSHYYFLSAREPEGFSIWNGPPFANGQPHIRLERVPCSSAKFSENGSRLLVIKSTSVISIYDCSNDFNEIRSFEIPSVLAAALSPRGTYLQTFQKPSNPQDKNVSLWEINTGVPVYQQFQKNMSKTTWCNKTARTHDSFLLNI